MKIRPLFTALLSLFSVLAVAQGPPNENVLQTIEATGKIPASALSGNSTAYVTCKGATAVDAAVQAAVNSLAAGGGGMVQLSAGTCTFNNPVTLANNVGIVGVPTAFPPQGNLLNNGWSLSGGTVITAGSATQAFIWNSTDVGTPPGAPPNTWGVNQLSGVTLKNLAFTGFTGSTIKIGAVNAEGLVMSHLEHLAFFNCGSTGTTYTNGTYAIELHNYAGINVSEIYISQCLNGLLMYTSVASATQQIGNSVLNDIQVDATRVTPNSNYVRSIVIGADPSISTSFSNEIRAGALAIYHFNSGGGRALVSDTATFTGGTTFTVATGSHFPVGMPVLFTASNGNLQANFTYFVLSQSGNTLSVGNCRGCSAITLPGSGTLTIQQYGYPLLDLGGLLTSTQGMPSSTFTGLDLEGDALGSVYVENSTAVNLGINQVTNSKWGVVGRQAQIEVHNMGPGITPDLDGNSGNSVWFGLVKKGVQFNQYPMGIYPDNTNNTQGLSLWPGGNQILAAPNLINRGNAFIYPNAPIGDTPQEVTTGATLSVLRSGYYACNSGSSQTYVLPAMSNGSVQSSTVGIRYKFNNIGAGACVIQPSANTSGQLINNAAHTTNQVSLSQGQWAEFIGSLNAAGSVTYWSVITTGTISALVEPHLFDAAANDSAFDQAA